MGTHLSEKLQRLPNRATRAITISSNEISSSLLRSALGRENPSAILSVCLAPLISQRNKTPRFLSKLHAIGHKPTEPTRFLAAIKEWKVVYLCYGRKNVHACAHTHAYTRTQTLTNKHTHTDMHTCAYTQTHTYTRAHRHVYAQKYTRTCAKHAHVVKNSRAARI